MVIGAADGEGVGEGVFRGEEVCLEGVRDARRDILDWTVRPGKIWQEGLRLFINLPRYLSVSGILP